MQNPKTIIQELCLLSAEVISNPTQSPSYTAKKLELSPDTIKIADNGAFAIQSFLFGPLIGGALYIWSKYIESQREKEEKDRMLREVIAKQQAVIRKLEAEEIKMRQENIQNQIEVEHLKQLLHILEQVVEQLKTSA